MSMTKQEAAEALRDLADRLWEIPAMYGTDQGDIEQLRDIASCIEGRFADSDDLDDHRALIQASNLLCQYVDEHLPLDYEIHLVMTSYEAYMELFDPWGNEITVTPDADASELYQMCCDAKQHEKEWKARELADKKSEDQS